MSEVILPFKIQDVTSYCSNASICAIARNTSDSEEWLANNFIQFHYETEYDVFHYMGTHILQKFCPFIQHEQLDRDLINSIWYGDIISMFEFMLSSNKYIYCYVDLYHINVQNKYWYDTPPVYHKIFIYGYNTDRSIFYCANNVMDGQYQTFFVRYEDMEKAYWVVPDAYWHTHIELYTYKPLGDDYLRINSQMIYNSMEDYLNSEYPTLFAFHRTFYTGISSLKYELNRIGELPKLDRRCYHLFYEHKSLMIKRINTLRKCGLIRNSSLHIQNYKTLAKLYYQLRGMVLKYNMTSEYAILLRIKSLFSDLIDMDIKAMESICQDVIRP